MSEKPPLHDLLKEFTGVSYCYFSPPATIIMKYPCVVYHRSGRHTIYADNQVYHRMNEYTITIIDPNPDNRIVDRLLDKLPYSTYVREYVVDGLYHSVLQVFYSGPRIEGEEEDQDESDA